MGLGRGSVNADREVHDVGLEEVVYPFVQLDAVGCQGDASRWVGLVFDQLQDFGEFGVNQWLAPADKANIDGPLDHRRQCPHEAQKWRLALHLPCSTELAPGVAKDKWHG